MRYILFFLIPSFAFCDFFDDVTAKLHDETDKLSEVQFLSPDYTEDVDWHYIRGKIDAYYDVLALYKIRYWRS